MCTAPRTETRPPPRIPPFLLAQNLSSKRIAPTDNMRPNFGWFRKNCTRKNNLDQAHSKKISAHQQFCIITGQSKMLFPIAGNWIAAMAERNGESI